MGVQRKPKSVTYTNPVIRAENGVRMRLDVCRRFGAACGQEAADAFCRLQDPDMGIAQSFRVASNIGMTAVIEDGRVCEPDECDGFASITCGIPLTDRYVQEENLRNPEGFGGIGGQVDPNPGRVQDFGPLPQR